MQYMVSELLPPYVIMYDMFEAKVNSCGTSKECVPLRYVRRPTSAESIGTFAHSLCKGVM